MPVLACTPKPIHPPLAIVRGEWSQDDARIGERRVCLLSLLPRRRRRAVGCVWRLLPHAPRRGARRGPRDMQRALASRGEAQHLGL